jgi:membrane protease YdiL (CAAX protease family)
MSDKAKKTLRYIEFFVLFFGVPLFIFFGKSLKYPSSIVLPILIAIFIYLKRVPDFSFKDLIRWKISGKEFIKQVIIILATSLVLFLSVWFFYRDHLFNLPKANLWIWGFMCIFYPLFSAYGQEIIYRVFLYYRYRMIFKTKTLFTVASGVAFSFVHIVYYSPISLILTLLLGVYLAATYYKTKSVLLTSFIHGFLGDMIFTVGLGGFFWLNMETFLQSPPFM